MVAWRRVKLLKFGVTCLCFLAVAASFGQNGESAFSAAGKLAVEGKRREALAKYLEAVLLLRDEGASPDRIASARKGAGDLALDLQDFVVAEEQLRQVVEFRRTQGPSDGLLQTLQSYARALRGLSRFEESYAALVDAKKVNDQIPFEYGRTYSIVNALREACYWDRNNVQAIEWGFEQLSLARKYRPKSSDEAASLHGLLEPLRGARSYSAEREYLDQWVALLQEIKPESPEMANALRYLCDNSNGLGDKAAAKRYAREAVEMLSRCAPSINNYFVAMTVLANYEADGNRTAEALELAEKAWSFYRERNQSRPLEIIQRAQRVDDFGVFGHSVMRVFFRTGKPERAIEILQEIQGRGLSQKLFNQLRLTSLSGSNSVDRYQKIEEQIGAASQRVSTASIAVGLAENALKKAKQGGKDETVPARELEAKKKELEKEQVELARLRADSAKQWTEVTQKFPAAFPKVAPLGDVLKYLPSSSVYLGYFLGFAPTVSLIVIHPDGRSKMVDLKPDVFALRDRVNKIREKLLSRNPSVTADLRAFYKDIVPDSVRNEVELAERLVITPDGPLWEIPFSALLAGPDANQYYLGLAKPILTTPSLSILGLNKEASKAKGSSGPVRATIVGDPVFSWDNAANLSAVGERSALWSSGKPPAPLPGTKAEAEKIAELYGSSAITADQATETSVRNALKSSAILHIATHGYVNNDYPLASGLLLTAPKAPPQSYSGDGALLAWEFLQMKSVATSLAVLSACETGLGKNLRAEGVDGLARSLQIAGIPTVVTSLWKVDDRSTAQLMVEFHKGVRAGKEFDVALCHAMRELFSGPENREPYFWAPFFVVGDQTNRVFNPVAK